MRRRRAILVLVCGTAVLAFLATLVPSALEQGWSEFASGSGNAGNTTQTVQPGSEQVGDGTALQALETLVVKGRAPKTGYARDQFGKGWALTNGCDTREIILYRDLQNPVVKDDCIVESGTLNDPYTGKAIQFTKSDSSAVQIDHVVALSDAWQTGAQQLTPAERKQLANDPLELLAVDGPANQAKSDADAASWLPANKAFRCSYVARQVTVKKKYILWVTDAEKAAIRQVLETCPGQGLTAS